MEKCSKDQDEKILKSSVVIVDVEGTTTSIGFVKDVLFPYAAQKVEAFVTENWEIPGVQEAIDGLRKRAEKDVEDKVESAELIPDKTGDKDAQIKAITADFKRLVSCDSKDKHFKELSGLIWEGGYKAGDIKGHLYEDVQPAIESWRSTGRRIYIYSSGSVRAQELLMEHSERGDVRQLFDGNFDTAVGNKQDTQSYKNIITKIGCKAEEALFLTDIVKEGEAAREAGLNVTLLRREGNAPLTDEDKANFVTVDSFADIPVAAAVSVKRKPDTPQEEDLPPAKLAKTAPEIEEKENGNAAKIDTEENGVPASEKAEDEAMEVDAADVAPVVKTGEIAADEEKDKTDCKDEKSSKDEAPQSMETDADTDAVPVQIDQEKSDDGLPKDSSPIEVVKDAPPVETVPESSTPTAETATDEPIPPVKGATDEPTLAKTETEVSMPSVETNVVAPAPVTEIVKDVPASPVEIVADARPVEVVAEPTANKTVETVPSVAAEKMVVANGDSDKTRADVAAMPEDKIVEKDLKTETELCPAKPSNDVSKESEVNISKIPEAEPAVAIESPEATKENESPDLVAKSVSPENGNSDNSTEGPPATKIESKLDEILGEEGAALEKECEETLFKVDKDISSTETLIQKKAVDIPAVAETTETPASSENASTDTLLTADVEMQDSPEPVPVVEPVVAVSSSEVPPVIAEVITDSVECTKPVVSETPKNDTPPPPAKIEEKSSDPTKLESPAAIAIDAKISESPVVAEKSSGDEKTESDSAISEEKAPIKTNGDSAQATANGDAAAAEERVNGDSCMETKDSEMNGKGSVETKELNGEATKEIGTEEREPEEKSNGTSTEKIVRGRTADVEIPCEQN